MSVFFQAVDFLLYPHNKRVGARDLSGASCIKYNAIPEFPPHDLSTSQPSHLGIPSPLQVQISTYEFEGGDINIQTIALNQVIQKSSPGFSFLLIGAIE